MRPEDAAEICGRDPGFVWLGMVDPGPDELAAMQATFGLHELAVEDAQSFHLRPKVEQYEDGVAFVVLRTARLRLEARPQRAARSATSTAPSIRCSPRPPRSRGARCSRSRPPHAVLPRHPRPPVARQRGGVAQRDLLTTVLQANMAVIGVEQSNIVRRISAWAAIITVPTFIASFYGMNFDHMPELRLASAPTRS